MFIIHTILTIGLILLIAHRIDENLNDMSNNNNKHNR